MHAALRPEGMRTYRKRLCTLLGLPEGATEMQIHSLIMSGFPAQHIVKLCEHGEIAPRERDWIAPLRTPRRRAGAGHRLTVEESDKLFRVVHVTALAETIIGRRETARRWLEKPQVQFNERAPLDMLTTTAGMWAVEKCLLHVTECAQKRPD